MPVDDYEIAAGFDQVGGFANFENLFPKKPFPRGKRVPLGSTTRTVLSGKQITDGEVVVTINLDGCPFTELANYITTYFGNYNTENAEVTLGVRRRSNNFAYYNAIAHLPLEGRDYTQPNPDAVIDLKLEFYLVEAL